MCVVTRKSDRLYASKTVGTFDELEHNKAERGILDAYINQGTPISFCKDLKDIVGWFPEKE